MSKYGPLLSLSNKHSPSLSLTSHHMQFTHRSPIGFFLLSLGQASLRSVSKKPDTHRHLIACFAMEEGLLTACLGRGRDRAR